MTLRAVLPAYGMRELLDTAELLASELVTNAYRHTKGPAALRLRGLGEADGVPRSGVRVTVWDTDSHVPSLFDGPACRRGSQEQPDERSIGGRGLLLVHEWADRWGGCLLGDDLFGCGGKLLWFELDARSAVDVRAAA
ncbi:ATP-binding protein [Streptomyces spongiae]|uniref:ATP-binding protein n=1 Tax=Streptomyces spongiae TaxID=565072 RepID=A0A5N8XG55_9ACTN|nr:ATP-binding protein [Streptomyces spongiae]MPY58204.1 ATP-binding protein [Streptomyces spongiae]